MRFLPVVWFGGLYAASALVVKLATSLILLWMARELPVEEYAAVGLLYALGTGVGGFAGVGTGEVVIGALKDHRSDPEQHQLFGTAITMFAVSAVAVSGVAWIASTTFGETMKLGDAVKLSAIAAGAVTALSALQAQLLRLCEEYLRSLSFNFVLPSSMVAGGAITFVVYRSVGAFFIGEILGGVVVLAALRTLGVGYWALWLRDPAVWDAFRKIPPFAIIALFGWLSGYGANFVINAMVAAPEVAKFTFLFTVASVMQLLASSFNMVWGPRFYRSVHRESTSDVERENRKFYLFLGLVLGLVGGCVIAFLPLGLNFFGGNLVAYGAMRSETFLLVTGYVLVIPWWHYQNYYLVFEKGRELRNNVIITGVLGMAVWIAAIWLLGAIGIYVGFAAQMFLRTVGCVVDAQRHWALSISWAGVLTGVLLCGIGWSVSHVWP